MEHVWSLGILTILLLTCQALAGSNWVGRTWQTNLNYNNSRNWNIGRVPCDADRVIFQSSESIVIEIPEKKTFLRELVLPSYIEVLLPKDGVVQFTEKKHVAYCDGQDAMFKPTHASRWTDPHNWDKWNQATPDLERVPCATDFVRFPPGGTYKILMPDTVKLAGLQINDVVMDSMDWFEFVNFDEGVRQFYKSDGDAPELEISGKSCGSSQWCECGNEYLHSKVCTSDCLLALCKEPVKPSGFCCSICGAYFLMESTSQNKHKLTEHINSFLRDKGVAWHSSRVGKFIQVVLVEEEEYTGEVSAIAEELRIHLVNSGMGWTAREFHASGHAWYPTTFGQVIGHFLSFMVFAALALAIVMVYYSQNWSWLRVVSHDGRPFVFARFENQSGEVVVTSEQPHSPVLPQAFDNPMYGATGQEQRNVTIGNPIYTELEETSNTSPVEEAVALESTGFSK